jgi:hypothetical protein
VLRKHTQRSNFGPLATPISNAPRVLSEPSERILAQVNFLIYRGSEMAATSELGPRLVLFVTVCTAVSQFYPDMAVTVPSRRSVRINSP